MNSKITNTKLPSSKGRGINKNNKKQRNQISNFRTQNPERRLTKAGPLSAAPVAQGRRNTTPKPLLRSRPNGDCEIIHREYIQEVNAAAGTPSVFTAQQLAINPGLAATFPWLSQIAPRFEKYQFKKLKFLYETEAATSLGGSVILTVDYDASDAAPTSKVQAMSYENAVRSPPWEESTHTSRQMDLSNQKGYFVRSNAIPASTDIKLYDTGNLFVCSQNVSVASSLLGELYVEYHVILMTPQIGDPAISGGLTAGGGVLSGANPFGTVPVPDASNVGVLVSALSVLTLTSAGEYLIGIVLAGTVMSALVATPSANLTVIATNALFSAGTSMVAVLRVRASAPGQTLTISLTATTVTSSGIYVAQAPDASLG